MMMDKQERIEIEKAVIDRGGELPPVGMPPKSGYWYSAGILYKDGVVACTKSEFMEARKRLENKPTDWPECANVLVFSVDCEEWLFGTYRDAKPVSGAWVAVGGESDYWRFGSSGMFFGDWRQSLEPRPQPDNKVKTLSNSKPPKKGQGIPKLSEEACKAGAEAFENAVRGRKDHKEGEGVEEDWLGSLDGLPPVGATVEFCRHPDDPKSEWCKGEVIGYHDKWVWMIYHGLPNSWSIDTLGFRPIQSHRDKVIEALCEIANDPKVSSHNVDIRCSAAQRALIEAIADTDLVKLEASDDQ